MAGRIPQLPLGAIIGAAGAASGLAGAGYMLYNSIFSGERAR